MKTKTVTYPNAIADAALLSPSAGKRLVIARIIASNVDGADMQISEGNPTDSNQLINVEASKGFMLEFGAGRNARRLDTDVSLIFNGGLAAVNTIVTVYYEEIR